MTESDAGGPGGPRRVWTAMEVAPGTPPDGSARSGRLPPEAIEAARDAARYARARAAEACARAHAAVDRARALRRGGGSSPGGAAP